MNSRQTFLKGCVHLQGWHRGRRNALVLIAAALCAAVCAQGEPTGEAEGIIRRAEEKLRAAKTLTFRVVQRYSLEGVALRTEEAEVSFRRPNLIRWHYEEPEEKLFVSDGKKTFFFIPAERLVYAASLKETLQGSPLLRFLAGGRPLAQAYEFELVEQDATESLMFRASPKKKGEGVPFLISLSSALDIRRVAWLDEAEGLMEIFLTKMRYNPPLDSGLFRFEPPADANIVEGPPFELPAPGEGGR